MVDRWSSGRSSAGPLLVVTALGRDSSAPSTPYAVRMGGLSTAQSYVVVALSFAAFAVEVFAFVDALRHRPDAYTAAGKRTKNFWMLVTGVAMALGFISLSGAGALGFLSIIAIVGAGIYLADVRPALRQVTGKGGGRNQGPYGPW